MRVIHGLTDIFQYAIRICHDIIVPIAKNAKPFGFQISRTLSVLLLLISMLATVKFDNEQSLRTTEIYDVWTNRMLASEFHALKLPGPKTLP